MKTQWDYSNLADAYLKRPDYSNEAIDRMISIAGVNEKDRVCDVGAGVAHLTLMLAKRKLDVCAVEPNDSMRTNGMLRTSEYSNVQWVEGVGENTRQEEHSFGLVTFGSSFNVCQQQDALKESYRILKPGGFFACMWNHRDLNDPVQSQIESIIAQNIPDYSYGSRREDPTNTILESGLFDGVECLQYRIFHQQEVDDCLEAWRSHATLYRQAGEKFEKIIAEIENFLRSVGKEEITIPYTTSVWIAKSVK